MTSTPGSARNVSTYTVVRIRTGRNTGPGTPRSTARTSPSVRISTSLITNSSTLTTNARTMRGRDSAKTSPLRNDVLTLSQPGDVTMSQPRTPKTTTELTTATRTERRGDRPRGSGGGRRADGIRSAECSGPPSADTRVRRVLPPPVRYWVKVGTELWKGSHFEASAVRVPSSVSALIAVFTHGVSVLPFARTALKCSG